MSHRPHSSACKREILPPTDVTPGFSHISQVLCTCIIEKTTSFTEQHATQLAGTCNCPFPVMHLELGSLQLPNLGCSHKMHFKHCWDPDTDLGLTKDILNHLSTISYLTKMTTKKGWWTYFSFTSLVALTPLFIRLPIEAWLQLVSFTLMWCNVQSLLQIQPVN